MDETLQALGGLMVKALPTFFLLVALHFYLKRVFFRPLDRLLQDRYEATEGAVKLAEKSLELATRKAQEYEAAIREARSEIYKEQEETRLKWRREQDAAIREARHKTGEMIQQAKAEIDREVADAKRALAAESELLADEIVDSIFERRPA